MFDRVYMVDRRMILLLAAICLAGSKTAAAQEQPLPHDPAAWGSDHVGRAFPEYVTGDECLFCHRPIGAKWNDNRHQLTIRPALADEPAMKSLRARAGGMELADQTQFLLGKQHTTRYLRRSHEYGKLDVLETAYVSSATTKANVGPLDTTQTPHWNKELFADRCAGCHATAVDEKTRAFSATSLDCVTCHGVVDLAHTKDVSRVFLSANNREARQVVSTCGQCHLRGGKSRSTGLAYPNTFVAGDNLFRDFQVDLSDAAIRSLTALDQHIFLNVREVTVFGRTTTCLSCHDVHAQSTDKHQQHASAAICASCHKPHTPPGDLRDEFLAEKRLPARSRVCDY